MFSSSHHAESFQVPPLNRSFSLKSISSKSNGHSKSKSTTSFSTPNGIKKCRQSASSRRPPTIGISAASSSQPLDVSMTGNSFSTSTSTKTLTSPIITIVVGRQQRIFAAHQDILCLSPFFYAALQGAYPLSGLPYASGCPSTPGSNPISPTPTLWLSPLAPLGDSNTTRRLALADEEPEIFSSVLEFLYKGDYHPRLVHNRRRNSWELEQTDCEGGGSGAVESTVYLKGADGDLLKDTVIYCAAERYGLEDLKKIALRKQGLHSGIQCSTILASARYAYSNTPETDSKLRAHYLALIIRSRNTFKRSGTMQMEMLNGGSPLFFDLFVALCNHVDDVSASE